MNIIKELREIRSHWDRDAWFANDVGIDFSDGEKLLLITARMDEIEKILESGEGVPFCLHGKTCERVLKLLKGEE